MKKSLAIIDRPLLDIKELREKPKLPKEWDYEKSVNKVKQQIYKWENLTKEMTDELWIARKKLSAQGRRTDLERKKKS